MGKSKGSRRRGCLVILIFVILSIAGIGLIVRWAGSALQEVGEVANEFMLALRDNQEDAAFALLSESFQQEVDTAENLYAALNGRTLQDWRFSSFSIRNNVGYITGDVTFTDGSQRVVRIILDNYEGRWWVSGFSF